MKFVVRGFLALHHGSDTLPEAWLIKPDYPALRYVPVTFLRINSSSVLSLVWLLILVVPSGWTDLMASMLSPAFDWLSCHHTVMGCVGKATDIFFQLVSSHGIAMGKLQEYWSVTWEFHLVKEHFLAGYT
ncbi:hypothetical protein Tco_1086199 [Tanacetum coccineum]